jgi:hypothetical protein
MNKRYITKIIFLFVLSLTISCKSDNKTIESNNNQQNDQNDLYKNIGDYINTNREIFISNRLKGIEFNRLTDEQEIFYNKRLDFFMAILNNDEKQKIEYYKYAKEYYEKFPEISRHYYFWSKDILDNRLFIILEEQFENIKLPMEYMHEYYHEMDMFVEIDEETQERQSPKFNRAY